MNNLMNGEKSSSKDNYNIGSVSQEDINPPCFDDERKYRGAVRHLQLPLINTLSNSDVDFELTEIANKPVVTDTKKIHRVPDAPLYLIPTHFIVNISFDELVSRVHDILGHMSGISCEFLESAYEWNGVFRKGSSYCKFQVHIYSNHDSYIVEVNRLAGDAAAFKSIYVELKDIINDPCKFAEESIFQSLSLTDVSPHLVLCDSDIDSALKPIMTMATSSLIDSQREATFILCNLSSHDDMQQPLCDNGFINVLVALISSPNELVRQHAMFALGNLSTSPSCQGAMLASGIVNHVLEMTEDGPYQSTELRREGNRILANLANRFPAQIVASVGGNAISSWIERIDNVRDDRLKIHAFNAKEYLTAVMT